MSNPSATNRRLMQGVMLAVALWGTTLALGAFLYGRDPATGNITFSPNPVRGLIVFASVAAFLGFWLLMLVTRRIDSKLDDEQDTDPGKKPASPGSSQIESEK